jgi:hypothetical protein
MPETIYLTQPDVLKHRTCPAYCWATRHRPDVVPPDPEHVQRREDDDLRVELAARQRFPGGVLIGADDPLGAIAATDRAIAAGASTIFRAAVLTAAGLHARADILTRHPSGHGWTLIEVTASTSLDHDHRLGVTYQRIAFAQAGYAIRRVEVMYLDKRYRRNGHLDLEQLFRHDTSITAWSDEYRSAVEDEIDSTRSVLRDAERQPACHCHRKTRAKRCPTFHAFHPEFPAGGTVFDLVSINQKRLDEALARGVLRLADWPADLKLSPRQRWQVETVRTGSERVRRDLLRDFLDAVRYPVHFLDYETFQTPVPLFGGVGPYQQVPFQYSVHTLHQDGRLEHREFLWTHADTPPVRPLAEALRRDIGDEGSVLVWWKGFEGRRNEELAEAVPHLADFLLGLNERMVDLMEPISGGMWVHPAFGGSTSIKKVLPVVAPDLAYDQLEIGHGSVATLRWKQCVVDDAPPDGVDPEEAFEHLRAYCRQDTLGMVRIWEHLGRLAGVETPAAALAGAAVP